MHACKCHVMNTCVYPHAVGTVVFRSRRAWYDKETLWDRDCTVVDVLPGKISRQCFRMAFKGGTHEIWWIYWFCGLVLWKM